MIECGLRICHTQRVMSDAPSSSVESTAADHAGPEGAAPGKGKRPRRPGGLTTVSVIAIVLGVLGALGLVMSVFSLLFSRRIQQLSAPPPGDPMLEAQMKLQSAVQAVTDEYLVPMVLLLALGAVLSALLLVGGFKALHLRHSARMLLIVACLLGLTHELGAAVQQSFFMPAVLNAIDGAMAEIAKTPGPGSRDAELVAMTTRAGMIGGIAVAVVMGLFKIGYYALSLHYLSRRQTRDLFLAAQKTA